MKKRLLMALITLMPIIIYSQDDKPARAEVNLTYGKCYSLPNGFSSFVNTYNDHYAVVLAKPMKNLPAFSSAGLSLAAVTTPIYFEFGYNEWFSKTESTFINNEKQHIYFKARVLKMDFGFGKHFKKWALHSYFGMEMYTSSIRAQYEYNDGSISSGFEKPLNGNYTGIIFLHIGPGLRCEKWFGPVGIFVKSEYLFRGLGGYASAEYIDDRGKSDYRYFPANYSSYISTGGGILTNAVTNNFPGFRHYAGISYRLNKNQD